MSLGWVQRNTSQYESDINNIILLADRDFKNKRKVFLTEIKSENFGQQASSIVEKGYAVLAKRKKTKPNEASWLVIIGYLDNGKILIVNDSKLGPALQIAPRDVGIGYYLFTEDKAAKKK
ncbi:hypothetical protein EHO60_03290 [Leptospira fletcheri]|uniref:Uncharacterized protein n=2 Tax=Leptospira fletcheri TaxID=2484981 RepID=A0A4R9GJS2_9LEPT|nr:hypothetical protein EHO60_03290 [Leptospira fletcheri]